MKLTTKTLVLGGAILLASTSLTAAFEEGSLLIWVGPNREDAQLQAVGAKFEADLGVPVKVEVVDPLTDKFQQAAATGDGPDIVLWAHDRFGEWAAGGLIAPVDPSPEFQAGILETAWDAVMFGGKTWGYPVGVEAIALVYNKDLVDAPPATFEEIATMPVKKDGVTKIMWDYNNTYFTFPLLAANGGYAFVKKEGVYDGKDTGVNNAGAVQGAEMLKKLIDDGVMPPGVDYGVMDGAMNKGEVAMVINGPWSWGGFKTSGINFGVAPLPSIGGKPAIPFIGVTSFAINAASPNADLAVEFIENYVLTDEGLATWDANKNLGALADISVGEAQSADPNIATTLANAAIGVPMPSNPEMGAFWSAMGPALGNITSGAQDPQAALDDAAKRILGE
jgi:maltose/maltodextrin transport system substrate-binding protein